MYKKELSEEIKGEEKLESLSKRLEKNTLFDKSLYDKFDVKRGLRREDGRGVLAGLTMIGEVHSYILDESEVVPVPGRLIYRGIDINRIVKGFLDDERFGFEEVVYLLIFGDLPNKKQLTNFEDLLSEYRILPQGFLNDIILKAPSPNMMNTLSRCVLALYSYDNDADGISIENVLRQSIQLIAFLPVFAVYGYQAYLHSYLDESLVIHRPEKGLSTAETILHMLRPNHDYTKLEAKLLDLALVLHAEHGGGNNSTFTTHVVTSSGTDTYSAIAAALGSLKGPRHGGANIKVKKMVEEIKENVKDWTDEAEVKSYLEKIINKEAFDKSGLIYGIGHAVYSISDPRAVVLKEYANKLAGEKGLKEEFNLYETIERIAPGVVKEKRNTKGQISANVDFYSGFVYSMLNIPEELYTPLFAIARIVGWCAHRIEELVNSGKIIRPAYKSISNRREYKSLDQR